MPYFPKREEQQPYHCQGCGGWFYPSDTICCVAHEPGTCCHKYERPANQPMKPAIGRWAEVQPDRKAWLK